MVEVGEKYNGRTLFRMKQFYNVFSNEKVPTMLTQLSWSHYLLLLSFDNYEEILYYIKSDKENNLTQRQLQDRIKSKEYKRLDEENKDKLISNEEHGIVDFTILIKNSNRYEDVSEKML